MYSRNQDIEQREVVSRRLALLSRTKLWTERRRLEVVLVKYKKERLIKVARSVGSKAVESTCFQLPWTGRLIIGSIQEWVVEVPQCYPLVANLGSDTYLRPRAASAGAACCVIVVLYGCGEGI